MSTRGPGNKVQQAESDTIGRKACSNTSHECIFPLPHPGLRDRCCGCLPDPRAAADTDPQLGQSHRLCGRDRRCQRCLSGIPEVHGEETVTRHRRSNPMLATLTLHLRLPACASLKEKRGQIKPLISRLHREFNISVAELDLQDQWDEAIIGCAMIGNDAAFLQSALQTVAKWVEGNWPDGDVWDAKVELV